MRALDIVAAVAIAAVVGLAAVGCQSAPRGRPVKLGPVETGPESLESVRARLQGTWELASFEVYPRTGPTVRRKVLGRLQFDQFGNMALAIRPEDQPIPADEKVQFDQQGYLSYQGLFFVDTASKQLRYEIRQEKLPERYTDDANVAGPSRLRHYELTETELTLMSKDDDGRVAARLVFRKIR
jgi:hypothetical protein